jgi:hypothetical protein
MEPDTVIVENGFVHITATRFEKEYIDRAVSIYEKIDDFWGTLKNAIKFQNVKNEIDSKVESLINQVNEIDSRLKTKLEEIENEKLR